MYSNEKIILSYKFNFLYERILVAIIEDLNVDISEENFQSTLKGLNQFSMNVVARSFKIYINNLFENSRVKSFEDFYINYVNEFKNSENHFKNFYATFPAIQKNLQKYYCTEVVNYKKILKIFSDNKSIIMNHFGISNFHIKDIKLGIGDKHEQGISTTLVKLNDTTFYIKWRNENFEKHHYYLYSYIKNGAFPLRKNNENEFLNSFLEFEDFYIQKEIKSDLISNTKKYFENVGVFIFVTYLLNGNDFHYENIISSSNEVISIDSETIFPSSSLDNLNVTNTSLLPSFTYKGKYVSGLSNNFNGLLQTFTKKYSITSAGISETIVPKDISEKEKNIPYDLYGNELYFCLNTHHIINGFKRSYNYFLHNKTEVVTMILKNFNKKWARFLKRQTNYYAKILWTSYNPKLLLKENGREKFIEERVNLSKKEVLTLKDGYIPLLEKQINLNYNDFNSLSYVDMHNQIIYIKESYNMERRELSNIQLNVLSPKHNEIIATEFFIMLKSNLLIHNKQIQWLDIFEEGDENARDYLLIETPLTIYYGKAGLYLFMLKYIIKHDDLNKYSNKLILNNMFNFIETTCHLIFNTKSIQKGVLDGASSILKLMLEIHNNKLKDYSTEIVLFSSKLSKDLENDTIYDYTSGSAGLLDTLTTVYYKIYCSKKRNIIKKNIDLVSKHLIENFEDNNNVCGWYVKNDINFGYAHGIAGILPAIYKAYLINNNNKLYKIIKRALHFLLSQRTKAYLWPYSIEKKQCLMNWCHGLPGIILAISQLYSLGLKTPKLKNEIKKGVAILKRHTHDNTVALCHGQIGNDYIGLFCSKVINDSDNINFFEYRIKNNLINIKDVRQYNKSFMNGLSGILYFYDYFEIEK